MLSRLLLCHANRLLVSRGRYQAVFQEVFVFHKEKCAANQLPAGFVPYPLSIPDVDTRHDIFKRPLQTGINRPTLPPPAQDELVELQPLSLR